MGCTLECKHLMESQLKVKTVPMGEGSGVQQWGELSVVFLPGEGTRCSGGVDVEERLSLRNTKDDTCVH